MWPASSGPPLSPPLAPPSEETTRPHDVALGRRSPGLFVEQPRTSWALDSDFLSQTFATSARSYTRMRWYHLPSDGAILRSRKNQNSADSLLRRRVGQEPSLLPLPALTPGRVEKRGSRGTAFLVVFVHADEIAPCHHRAVARRFAPCGVGSQPTRDASAGRRESPVSPGGVHAL